MSDAAVDVASEVRVPFLGITLTNKEEPMSTAVVVRREAVRSGISFGSALAIAISWSTNQSILWAILHGIFSWFYVIYYVIAY
jgi:hypothetical protein